jgi:hypothetical protein
VALVLIYIQTRCGDKSWMRKWQVEHIGGHLWRRYSIMVNQVMVPTLKLSSK